MAMRYLRKNHSIATPRNIVFVDTETHKEAAHNDPLRFNHFLRNGCAIFYRQKQDREPSRRVLHFDESDLFWFHLEQFLRPRETTYIVCHKASFDMGILGLWERLDSSRYILDAPRSKHLIPDAADSNDRKNSGLCIIDDPPFIVGLSHGNKGRFVCLDTLNWFRVPLAEMGAQYGVSKLTIPGSFATPKDWATYCQRDVEILEKAFLALVDFTKINDFGMFRYTAPAQALAAYRHRFMPFKITLHDEMAVKKLERSSYFGGEVRGYWAGKVDHRLYQLDVNGMYPYVMRENLFPVRLLSWNKSGQILIDKPWPDLDKCVATVQIQSKANAYPIRSKDGIAYCSGTLETSLAGPELCAAYDSGDILKFTNWARYEVRPIFRDYVDELYALRQRYKDENNKPFAELCKLFLNSLYGKFGQRSFGWELVPNRIPPRRWTTWLERNVSTGEITKYRSIGPYVFKSEEPGEHPNSFPAIASFVTSYGREYMRKLRGFIGEQHLYYQGVDSLVVDWDGFNNAAESDLLSETELGKLKLVCYGENAEFRGLNSYRIGAKEIRAGLRRNAKAESKGVWWQEIFETADCTVAREPNSTIQSWQTIFRQQKASYRGYVRDGQRLRPLHLLPIDDNYSPNTPSEARIISAS